jgi:hypothetical protein
MAYASPLLQLNQELANPELTLETINQLATQYEEKIRSLPTKEAIIMYASKFLWAIKGGEYPSNYNREFTTLLKENLEDRNLIKIPPDSGGDIEQFCLSFYAMKGWLTFHPELTSDRHLLKPKKITLATSLYKCADWIEIFLENFCQQLAFSESQLILFDCERNSSHLQKAFPYLKRYENIAFVRLSTDPKLYNVWNLAASICETKYLGNLNHDDLRHPFQLAELIDVLDRNPEVQIASSSIVPYQFEDIPTVRSLGLNELEETTLWGKHEEPWFAYLHGKYGIENLFRLDKNGAATNSQCIPHCAPIWRKSLHKKYGFFNEDVFASAADWGFWLNCLASGDLAYIVGKPYTYYYVNPNSYMRQDVKVDEIERRICNAYNDQTLDAFLASSRLYEPKCDPLDIIDLAINL